MNANQAPSRIFFGWWIVMSFTVMTFLDDRPRTVPVLSPVASS
jgi:hypothetical protein